MFRGLTPVPPMYRGFVLHPDDANDPYVFRVDLSGFGPIMFRVVFSREPATGTVAAHLDLMPLSLQRQAAPANPRWWLAGALGAFSMATTAIAVRRRGSRHNAASKSLVQ